MLALRARRPRRVSQNGLIHWRGSSSQKSISASIAVSGPSMRPTLMASRLSYPTPRRNFRAALSKMG